MHMPGTKKWLTESKTYTSGQQLVVSLADLPPGRKIKMILIRAVLAIVTDGSGSAIGGAALAQCFSSVRIGKHTRSTGQGLRVLNWHMRGKEFSRCEQVPAAANTYQRVVEVMVPYEDLACKNPDDARVNDEFFRSEPIEIQLGNTTSLYSAHTSISGTVRCIVFTTPADAGVIPAVQEFNYADFNQQTVTLPAGVYSHIHIYKEDGTTIADSGITDVSLYVDGDNVYNRIQLGELATEFNWYNAQGATLETESASAAQGGEELTDKPGTSGGAGSGVTAEWLPLYTPGEKYTMTDLIKADQGIRIDTTGSATAIRVGVRRFARQTDSEAQNLAAVLGYQNAARAKFEPKTASKMMLPATKSEWADYLPKQMVA